MKPVVVHQAQAAKGIDEKAFQSFLDALLESSEREMSPLGVAHAG
jgi:hypothetical protein